MDTPEYMEGIDPIALFAREDELYIWAGIAEVPTDRFIFQSQ
jgi:hypothetical protein